MCRCPCTRSEGLRMSTSTRPSHAAHMVWLCAAPHGNPASWHFETPHRFAAALCLRVFGTRSAAIVGILGYSDAIPLCRPCTKVDFLATLRTKRPEAILGLPFDRLTTLRTSDDAPT